MILMYEINIYDVIRRNIKKYRMLKNMTQAELAEKTNLTHDFIRQIESNKIARNFSVQTVYDISLALEIGIELLFENKEKEL